MLKNFSLKNRMLLSIGTIAFIAFAITIVFVSTKASQMAKLEALDKTRELAYHHGGIVENGLDSVMGIARTLTHSIEGMIQSGNPNRAAVVQISKHILEQNEQLLGTWSNYDPNGFDGNDAEAAKIKQPYNNPQGILSIYYTRTDNKINLEDEQDSYESYANEDWYALPKNSGQEMLIEPYIYPVSGMDVLMTSAAVPIRPQGKSVGVGGVDLSLDYLTEEIKKITPYETGYAYLVSNQGIMVAHPDTNLVGQELIQMGTDADILDAIKNGKEISVFENTKNDGESYIIYTPLTIGRSKAPWSFVVSVPMSKVLERARGILYTSIFIGLLSLSLLMTVVFFIAHGIAKPVSHASNGLNDVADQVSQAAMEVSSSSQSLAEGSTEQAASIEETSSSLEEMAAMTRQNAEHANQANQLMSDVSYMVKEANDAIAEMTTSMADIAKSGDETSKIIKTIDEIAFQTNLLALNAAVEAARAGEAGAGFAVVADEVRNLAMRAAEAAKTTSSLIEDMVHKTDNGAELVNKTNTSFQQVYENSGRIETLVKEIASASSEQALGIEQINKAVSEMESVTQRNTATAEESASVSEEMSAQAAQMKAYVRDLIKLIEARTHADHMERSIEEVRKKPVAKKLVHRAQKQQATARIAHNKPDNNTDDDFENF